MTLRPNFCAWKLFRNIEMEPNKTSDIPDKFLLYWKTTFFVYMSRNTKKKKISLLPLKTWLFPLDVDIVSVS